MASIIRRGTVPAAWANTYLPVGLRMQTVTRVATDDGRQHSSIVDYTYEGGLWSDAERRFLGFDAYQKMLESGVDLVLLATPPHFRPIHYAAAIAAGKHVYLEKPVAVDVPGARRVMRAGEAQARLLRDHVVVFEEDTPLNLIEEVRPDILVKGETGP